MNYGDFPLEETIHVFFTTRAFATGIPGTLSAATVAVYEDITATPIQTSVAVTETLNSIAGLNAVPIVATAANGYEVGKNYHVVIEAGTVDSVSVVGEVVAYFSIGRSAAAVDLANGTDGLGAIKAETAAIVADTGTDGVVLAADAITEAKIADNAIATEHIATGAISADSLAADTITAAKVAADVHAEAADAVWDEAQADHVAVGSFGIMASEIASILVDTMTTLQGELDGIQADTEDIQAQIGTAGAGLTDLGGMSTGMKAEVNTEVDGSMVTYGLDHLVATSVTGTDVADDSIIAFLVDDAATADWDNYDNTTASLEALNVDTDAIIADLANGTDGLGAIKTDTAAVKVVTDKFVFTNANEVDANTKSINDAEVVGDGNATPWDGV